MIAARLKPADCTFAIGLLTRDSQVTGTTRTYAGIEAFNAGAGLARIHGGMHFRPAVVAGEELGRRVGQWATQRHFQRQE